MKKKEDKDIKKKKKCTCGEDCNCGCHEGKECTCKDCHCTDCNCGCKDGKACTCGEECDCKDCDCGCKDGNCTCDEDCNCENCECTDEVIELKQTIGELTDKLARTQAEMINFKKRKEDETSLRLKYCNGEILLQLVAIIDNFERALNIENISEEANKYLQGFKMMYTSMLEILRANEVVEIEVFGKQFDPTTSEALLVEHNDEYDSGVVIEVLQKGYMYKDKILRPAMVKIND